MAALGSAQWSALSRFTTVIFVTVGSQLPFERLVAAVDSWSGNRDQRPDVLAASGKADYPILRCVPSLDGPRYAEVIAEARIIIAHAGAGSILTALDLGVPIIVMPRDHLRGEIRDDHQSRTARQLEKMALVAVAWNEADLPGLIDVELAKPQQSRGPRKRTPELADYLRSYLQSILRR